MHTFVLWVGFLGGWALVAGPVYQAILELRAEDTESIRLSAESVRALAPAAPSRWWLVLPPVYLMVRHRKLQATIEDWLQQLPDRDFRALAQYGNKAAAWVMVGFGGLAIATKETYELSAGSHWPTVVFCVVEVLMLLLSMSFGPSRLHWLDQAEAERRH